MGDGHRIPVLRARTDPPAPSFRLRLRILERDHLHSFPPVRNPRGTDSEANPKTKGGQRGSSARLRSPSARASYLAVASAGAGDAGARGNPRRGGIFLGRGGVEEAGMGVMGRGGGGGSVGG